MYIEDQYVSLNYAKRLKELNLKQESVFWWNNNEIYFSKPSIAYNGEYWSAYSVAELGEILLPIVKEIETEILDDGFYRLATFKLIGIFDSKNEADARAKILICAIENNLVTEEWKKQWII